MYKSVLGGALSEIRILKSTKDFLVWKKNREYYQSVCPDFFVSLQKVFVVKVMKTATKLPTAKIPVETLWSIIDQDPFLLREW